MAHGFLGDFSLSCLRRHKSRASQSRSMVARGSCFCHGSRQGVENGMEVRVSNNPQHPTHNDPLHSGLTKSRRTVLVTRDQVFRHVGVYAVEGGAFQI